MASHCHNLPKIKEHLSEEEKIEGRVSNGNYKSRCLSVHSNRLPTLSSNSLHELDCNSLPNCQPTGDSKIRFIMGGGGGGRKRTFTEAEAEDSNKPNLDLSLSLSLPDSATSHQNGDQTSNIPSSSCTPLSSASTQRSCTSVALGKRANEELLLESRGPETPSLVLMGCSRCLMYIMVSEVDPKCPKCKSSALIDIFHRSPSSKRLKKLENSSSKSD